jgi:uncharacterized membrane protein HdeD (DUF308 family)
MNSSRSGAASPQPTGQPTARHRSSQSLAGTQLADILCRNWWVLLLRGLFAVIFGVLALLLTKAQLRVLVLPFGMYTFVDGILGVGIVIGESSGRPYWWVLLFRGLTGIGVGLLTFLALPPTLLVFFLYIAIWATTIGILDILTAHYLRRKLGGEWLLVLCGLASVAFGALLFTLLAAKAPVLARVIATYAFFFGVLLGILAFRARAAPVR